MLEESNETIFQMKDAMYFSFKELQLNMDYIFCIAIRSNITLHDPFLRIIIWINSHAGTRTRGVRRANQIRNLSAIARNTTF